MVKLIIEDDEGKTTVVPLIRDEITIGRKEGNTIRLTERNVSRRHAKLLKVNGAIFIEDLSSYNGIKVNGNKVNGRIAITEGDRIQIGDYILGLKIEAASAQDSDEYESAQTMEIQRIPDSELPTEEGTPVAKPIPAPPAAAAAKEEKPASGKDTDRYGRLVCVSSNFQAKEWLLNKSTMVLGRTDDNDIVINHRSISRHHARITSEGNRYTIRDLESANGVRINGEEYGKVELRRGDHVDLGHVRLRFVAPGEDFVFKRDATVVDISKPGGGRGLLWALISGAVVLVVGLVIWHFTTQPPPVKPPITDKDPVATPETADAGTTVATPDPLPDAGAAAMAPDQLMARINNFIATEAWDDAIKDCGKLTAEQLKGAAEACKKAEEEKAAYELFEKFNQAATQNKYLDAVRFHNEIPEGSIYKSRDLKIYNDAKAKYLAGANKRLDEHVSQRECEKAQAEADLIKQVVPTDTQADAKVKTCRQAMVAANTPATPAADKPHPATIKKPRPATVKKPRPATVKKPVVKKPVTLKPVTAAPTLEDLQKAKALLQQARETFVHGKYARSMSLARQVLKLNPGDQMAIQIIGASACYLKNAKNAKWAFARLKAVQRNYLRTICQRNGVTLE